MRNAFVFWVSFFLFAAVAETMTLNGDQTVTGDLTVDGTLTASSVGSPTYRELFAITFGNGTSAGNWNTGIQGAGCFATAVGTGVGGTSVFAGQSLFDDADNEELFCRIGRVKPGVNLSSVTIQIDAVQTINDTSAPRRLELTWQCYENGVNFSTTTVQWKPSTPIVIDSTPTAIAATEMMFIEKSTIDFTVENSSCAVGNFMVLRLDYDSATSPQPLRVFGWRGYSYE